MSSARAPLPVRRWYTHRWNSAASLRLILTIVPRVPRFLVPLIGVVTTAVCLASMNRERGAVTRNLSRVLRAGPIRVGITTWRVFYNFSRFMVGYCILRESSAESLEPRVRDEASGASRIRDALASGRGVIVLTGHLGNWEVGTRMLTLHGVPVNLVMRPERTSPGERWLMRVRRMGGAHVIRVGLFGAPVALPSGPFLLAYSCDAPLVPAFVLQDGWWRWRSHVGEVVRFPRTGDRDRDLRDGAEQYAAVLEAVVRAHPDQWFNFFDVWDDPEELRR